jgi:L-aspartate oxidase
MRYKTDILVIGSGIAGLTFTIKMAEARPDLKITVLTKTTERESNTRYAQGGVAAVWDFENDNFEKHVADTLDAGAELNDVEVVRMVVREGPERVKDIIKWGARFDKNESDEYELGREGGHSENRILHFKDLTGWEIQRTLADKVRQFENVEVLEHYFAMDLITQHHLNRIVTRVTPGICCYGAYVLNKNTNETDTFLSRMTFLATGGAGQIYKATTNPVIATGDGIAMVYRAKGRIANMEFVQFHPTALYNPKGLSPDFLVSEAVRGYGGILKAADGEEFMDKYDPRKSLAPRDIVARAIDHEMKVRGVENMFLDVRHIDKKKFLDHFPTIHEACLDAGVNPMKQMIPVVPACHYMCGGIVIDKNGATSIKGLYAAGEATYSGLHGANRLASNSLLGAMVFADRSFKHISELIDQSTFEDKIPDWNAKGTTEPNEMILITQSTKELKEIMSSYVGIVRTNTRLKRAVDRILLLYKETEDLYKETVISPQLFELRNMITLAFLVTSGAQMRQESRGLHYNTDYPDEAPYNEITYM